MDFSRLTDGQQSLLIAVFDYHPHDCWRGPAIITKAGPVPAGTMTLSALKKRGWIEDVPESEDPTTPGWKLTKGALEQLQLIRESLS